MQRCTLEFSCPKRVSSGQSVVFSSSYLLPFFFDHHPLPTTRHVDYRTCTSLPRRPYLWLLLQRPSAPDEVQPLPLSVILRKSVLSM